MMDLLLRPWKLYADATGRSTPAEFWLFFVTKYVGFVILLAVYATADVATGQSVMSSLFGWLAILWILGSFVPSVVLLVRRCHDFDATGKWALLTFVPYLGFLAVIVIGAISATRGENQYGYDPRDPDPYDVAATFE